MSKAGLAKLVELTRQATGPFAEADEETRQLMLRVESDLGAEIELVAPALRSSVEFGAADEALRGLRSAIQSEGIGIHPLATDPMLLP